MSDSSSGAGSARGRHSHLTLCFKNDGTIDFYPEGEPTRIEQGLRDLLKFLARHPEAIKHAAQNCKGHLEEGRLDVHVH